MEAEYTEQFSKDGLSVRLDSISEKLEILTRRTGTVYAEQLGVLFNQRDIFTELDSISGELRTITTTTNFMSNILSLYIIYRSVSWLFR